jgi:hypothetical protein
MEVLLAGVGRNVQNAGILRCFGSKTPLTLTPPFCSALGVELISPTDEIPRGRHCTRKLSIGRILRASSISHYGCMLVLINNPYHGHFVCTKGRENTRHLIDRGGQESMGF